MVLPPLSYFGCCMPARRVKKRECCKYAGSGIIKSLELVTTNTILELRKPTWPEFYHRATSFSPEMLICLPTEIIDQILQHLDKPHWLITRKAHRLFKASSRSFLFRRVELCDFRTRVRHCQVEKFIQLMQDDVQLRNYVHEVRVRSVLDPTVHDDVEKLLPQVLGLLKLQSLVIAFPELEFVTSGTQEECANMLQRTLLGFSIPQIMIECQYPSVKLMRGLKQLPVNAVTILMPSRSTKHDSSFQMSFWLEQLALPSMKCVDVGDWQLEPSQIQIICDAAPNLAEMRVTVDRDSTNAAMLQVLSLKQHSLRTLGLRRQPACKHGIADFTTLDLSTFSTLHTLAIDASFLFGPVSCSIVYRTAEFNHYLPELNTRLYNRSILPPNFRTLHIYFNSPHGVFSQGTHSFHGRTAELPRGAQAMEYDWMLELSRRNPSLKHLILTEERHICEGVGYGDPATPRVDAGYVTRFVVPPMVRKAFKERGLDVDIELQLRDDAPLLEAGLRFDPYYIA